MALQDRGLVLADRVGDPLTFIEFDDDAAKIIVNRVIVIEGADVLGDRRERPAERRKSPAVGRMGVGRGDRVGPRCVDARMNDESGGVDGIVAFDNLAMVVAAVRFETLIWLKCTPNGFTQNVSGNSGSRAVMCPATPSSKPNFEKRRKPAANLCFRCNSSSAWLANVGGLGMLPRIGA
jgi:hypothetical protein